MNENFHRPDSRDRRDAGGGYSGSAGAHIDRRNDVDGMRAVAVIAVVIYHAFPTQIPGGFVGVDVFFVISGFIISRLIFQGLDQDTFSFAGFYARRIRRIFPPVIAVMLFSLGVGWFVLFSDEYAQLGKHVTAGASFLSNFALWSEAGYFDAAKEVKPLLHLWSLGIEEQFYLVFPVLAWAVWKLRLSFAAVFSLLGVASLAYSLVIVQSDAVADFYSPASRVWELLAGSLLAWTVHRGFSERWHAQFCNVLSATGMVLLVLAFAFIHPEGFPGVWAIGPVVGAVLVIAAGPTALINRWVLSNSVALWFGWISFALYLWHWPLLSFARILLGEVPSFEVRAIAVLLAVALAWISTQFFETPIRRQSGRKSVAALVVVMVLTGGAGIWVWMSAGLSTRDMAKIGQEATDAARDWAYETTRMVNGEIVGVHTLAGSEPEQAVFLGSSIMGQYFPRAKRIYQDGPQPRLTAVYASRNHCTPMPMYDLVSGPEKINCLEYYRAAMQLAKREKVVRVVLAGEWPSFHREGAITAQGAAFVLDIKALVASGKAVYLIGRSPSNQLFDPLNLARASSRLLGSSLPDQSIDRAVAENLSALADLERIAALAGATVVNPLDYLCGPATCPTVSAGKPLYNDSSHIRAEYARSSATFIDELVE